MLRKLEQRIDVATCTMSMNYLFSICIGSTSFEMFYSCKALPRNFIGLTLIKSHLYIIANLPFN